MDFTPGGRASRIFQFVMIVLSVAAFLGFVFADEIASL